jgi:hypothetical protein
MDATGKPTTEYEHRLWKLVANSIRSLDHTVIVDPVAVAKDTFEKLTPELRDIAAILMLRQIARNVLRNLHKPNGKKKLETTVHRASEKAPTFPGPDFDLLQERYPKAHTKDGERGYVPRDQMTNADWDWNLDQLDAKQLVHGRHFFQLKRWGELFKKFIRHEGSKEYSWNGEA